METTRAGSSPARSLRVPPEVVRPVADARRLVVLTGAGMSHESGIPTFRDALTGLWAQYQPEDLATPEAFQRAPARVFGWYLARRRRVRSSQPHPGYQALAELVRCFEEATIVTQDVDGLHARAGNGEVVELHGSLDRFRCLDRGHPFDAEALEALMQRGDDEMTPPSCETCGSPVRPGVVWFGEALPMEALARAGAVVNRCDVLLVVGTSSLVYPAAGLPMEAARAGATVIEINPAPTPLTARADFWWKATAGAALTALAGAIPNDRGRS